MRIIDTQHLHFDFDRGLPPAAVVNPGDEIALKTLDACCGEVRSVADFLARRQRRRRSNPLTGPIYVQGARAGDTLVVTLCSIQLEPDGFQLVGPDRGIITTEVEDWTCHVFRVEGGHLVFPNGIRVPADPVIGTFGNAPAGQPTFHAGPTGGNMDVPAARMGARLYVPVAVDGALFSLGDVHARQGDGEVVGAPEIGATVTVRIDLQRGSHSEWCMIEDAERWHSLCSAPTEADAARLAVLQNARFVSRKLNASLEDALILLTMTGRISIGRTGKWGNQAPVVSASFPKQISSLYEPLAIRPA